MESVYFVYQMFGFGDYQGGGFLVAYLFQPDSLQSLPYTTRPPIFTFFGEESISILIA
jgi:hypothetical protein